MDYWPSVSDGLPSVGETNTPEVSVAEYRNAYFLFMQSFPLVAASLQGSYHIIIIVIVAIIILVILPLQHQQSATQQRRKVQGHTDHVIGSD